VQLFLVCLSRGRPEAPDVGAALGMAARATPQLDTAALATGRSTSGRLSHARVSHPASKVAPRRYVAEHADELVLFDGFPIEREGAFAAHDARVLLARWGELQGRLDGIFSAVRVDLGGESVECLIDPLGIARIFVHDGGDHLLLSNSVEAIRIQAGVSAPDPLGLSSLLSLGYVARDHTLLADVRPLSGGTLHRFSAAGATSTTHFSPETVLSARPPRDLLTARVMGSARAAARSGASLRSGLTAGRDTRVLLALLRAAGVAEGVDFYTSGAPDDIDVLVARTLAERFRLRHRLLVPRAPTGSTWSEHTTRFVVRTDGIANLELISDWVDHEEAVDELALEFWGGGGEVGRTNKHVLGPLLTMLPGARGSHRLGQRLLVRGVADATETIRTESIEQARQHLLAFAARRRAEGWPAEALHEAFYAFEFLPARPGMAVRRSAASADLFSPFTTQAFVEHCLSVRARERYLEMPHHNLIGRLAPEVDALPYLVPWKPQREALGLPLALDDARRRLGRRIRGTSPLAEATGTPFYVTWYESGLPEHRELLLSHDSSSLWNFVDRGRYERLLGVAPAERRPHVRLLCRVLSAFWYLHADRRALSSPVRDTTYAGIMSR